MQKSNINLILEDINKFTLITQVDSSLEPTYTSYRVVGRDTTDHFRNKVITDPSNTIAANYISSSGNQVKITGTPAIGTIIKAISANEATWQPDATGVNPIVFQLTKTTSDTQTLFELHGKTNVFSLSQFVGGDLTVNLPAITSLDSSTTAIPGTQLLLLSPVASLGRFLITGVNGGNQPMHSGEAFLFSATAAGGSWQVISHFGNAGTQQNNVRSGKGAIINVNNIHNVVHKPVGIAISANYSIFLGSNAGNAANNRTGVIAIGYDAASSTSMENYNVAIGYSAGQFRLGEQSIAIGYFAMANPLAASSPQYNVAIGGSSLRGTAGNIGVNNVAIGDSTASAGCGNGCVIIGKSACASSIPADNSITIGSQANSATIAGFNSVCVGTLSTCASTRGVVIGMLNTSSGQADVTIIGYNNIATSARDLIIGRNITATAGTQSVIIQNNQSAATTPATCVIIGALNSFATTSTGCTIVGRSNNIQSGAISFGNSNICSSTITNGVILGLSNSAAGTGQVIIAGAQNSTAATTLGNLFIDGRSNSILNAATGVTCVGQSNTVNFGNASSVIFGNSNTINASTIDTTVLGANCTAGNAGIYISGITVVGSNCSAVSSGGALAAVGVACNSTGTHSASFGVNSRAVGSTFNVSVPQSVRHTGAEIQSNAHLRFGAPMTSYSTIAITANGVFDFTIATECAFVPCEVIAFNPSASSTGSITVDVGNSSNSSLYLTASVFALTAAGFNILRLPAGASTSARSANGLRVTISGYTQTIATFAPRITVLGMLYQIA